MRQKRLRWIGGVYVADGLRTDGGFALDPPKVLANTVSKRPRIVLARAVGSSFPLVVVSEHVAQVDNLAGHLLPQRAISEEDRGPIHRQ
jgi:hypothetical protein